MNFLNKTENPERNTSGNDALLQESEERLQSIKHAPKPASQNFQHQLKMSILEKRRQKFTMDSILVFLDSLMRPKRLVPAVSFLIVVAVILNTANIPAFIQGVQHDPFGQFSKLIISPAHAMDNFGLEPEALDSLGVEGGTSYLLTSKEKVDTKLIRESILVEPPVEYTVEQLSDTQWRIAPKEALPPNTIFKISLKTSFYDETDRLQNRDYSWAYQVKDSFKILNHIPGNETTNVPTDSGIEVTFSHDNFVQFDQYVSVEPKIEHRFEKHGRTLVVVPTGGLQKATIYSVTVKKGLPLSGTEQKLAEDYVFRFETEGVERFGAGQNYFNVYDTFLEFSTSEKPVVQVYASNSEGKNVQVEIFNLGGREPYVSALNKRDEIPWWGYSKNNYQHNTSELARVASFTTDIKKAQYVQFVDFPENLPAGFYVVNLTEDGKTQQAWFQITDLSAYINVTKTDTIVWAHNAATGQGANNASLALIGESNRYTTNSGGVARFKTPQVLIDDANKNPHYLTITHGSAQLILPTTHTSRSYYYGGVSKSDDYWRYLYTDRPKYQPTDVIKFWGMAKIRDGARITEPARLELVKDGYVDYYYQPVRVAEFDVQLTDLGTFEGEIPLERIRPDYYTVQLRVGDTVLASKYIEIRPYVKPAYQLSITPDRARVFTGETINFDVQASFFEGTPVPGLDLAFKMPEGGYAFTSDEQGQAHLTYTKKYRDCPEVSYCWPQNIWLQVAPKDSELAEISAEQSVQFYGSKVFSKSDVTYPEAGVGLLNITTYGIDLSKESDPKSGDDIPIAPNTKVAGNVTKITYEKRQEGTYYDFVAKRAYPRYRYDQREEKVDSFSFFTDAEGKHEYRIVVEPETSYRVNMKIYDDEGKYDVETEYLYYYDGAKTNRYNSYYRGYYNFEFPSGTEYSIGEPVRANMADYEGNLAENDGSNYLFLQLQNGLQEHALSGSPNYAFNFEERDIPNVNLVGVRFKNGAYFTTDAGYFRTNRVSFRQEDRKLAIAVETDKDRYEPGEDATLSIRVTDPQGRAQQASVNVNIVDEAYYAVISDTATPLSSIYTGVGDGSYFSKYSHKTLSDAAAAEMGGCFLAGTQILMADGTTKPIEEIRTNDRIQTLSDPLRVIRDNGTVTQIFSHLVDEYLIINGTLRVTPEHMVYANHGFREAGLLVRGDWLLQLDGTKVFVESIEIRREPVMVYNFTVEPHHTYIADGFYVHNDKGDGIRDFFTDAPLFQSVITDRNGRASVTLTLPDNITSWRATVQAISNSLYVGAATANLNVSLPVFADVTVSKQYLAEDRPTIRMRAFGTALTSNDTAAFTVKSESLGASGSTPITAKAFQSAYADLPPLRVGTHDILYSLKTEKGNDAVLLPITVVSSELAIKQSETRSLTTDTRVTSPAGGPVRVVLGDTVRIQLMDPLERLTWSWGDRVDQSIARKRARELLNTLLGEEKTVPAASPHLYQQANGGIALLPYASTDLELSARIAITAADEFDTQSLQQFFLTTLNNRASNREEITLSLLGLSALDTPILPILNNWRERDDLSVKEYLYVALAAHELGADELARSIYYSVVSQYAQEKSPEIIIKISDNETETRELTAIAAVLGAAVQAPEHEGLWNSVQNFGWSNEILVDVEKLAYIQESLKHIVPQEASVAYEVDGKKREASFDRASIHAFEVLPRAVDSVRFTEIKGRVGITTITEQPIQTGDIRQDTDIGIRREYYVNGKQTNSFSERDLIEIRLYPKITAQALDGSYQITDILPNGLLPVTKLYGGYYDSGCHAWYPYNVDGQKVKYHIWKSWNNNRCSNYISYYARVKNKGSYKAEPAILQSIVNPEFVNYSDSGTVTIR